MPKRAIDVPAETRAAETRVAEAGLQGDGEVICGKGDADSLDHCDVHVVDPERVRAVRERLVTAATAEQMAAVFKVLADPSRCRLVAAIIEAGELCVCDLAATVGMTESNVSHHLRVLRAHGLVRARRQGKMVYYSPDDAHIRVLLDITREHVVHGPEGRSEAGREEAETMTRDGAAARAVR